jgi:uncharacterized surface protein with fasciclin (FAS1) repeats
MNKLKSLFLGGTLALVFVAAPAHAQTIVGVAQSDDNFSALVDAVIAQNLVETLSSEGPFTVFAPTNDAFDALPAYIGNVLESDPDLLGDILTYHVVPGELFAADVLAERRLETVQGEHLRVFADQVRINGSDIIDTDIAADNGVVHVIDEVLIPGSVYRAVVDELRADLRDIITMLREVRQDQVADRTGR